jgi:hypothetical protein
MSVIALRSKSSPRQLRHAQGPWSRQQVPSTKINIKSRLHGALVGRSVLLNSSKLVKPVRKSVAALCNLNLHGLGCLLEIVASEINLGDSRNGFGKHARAHVQVGVSCPSERRPPRVGDVVALNPCLRAGLVFASLDVLDQIRRPRLGVGETHVIDVADLVGNGSVPECVKVPAFAIESHVDGVATNSNSLSVQGLGDVAQEVDDPAKSIVDFMSWQDGRLLHALGVIGDGGNNAALFGMAIPLEVHVAAVRWVVLSVDVVKSIANKKAQLANCFF